MRRTQVWFLGLTPQQQPGSYQDGEMMRTSVFWWRKPEYPGETTDLGGHRRTQRPVFLSIRFFFLVRKNAGNLKKKKKLNTQGIWGKTAKIREFGENTNHGKLREFAKTPQIRERFSPVWPMHLKPCVQVVSID